MGYATRPVNQGFSVNTATFVDVGSTEKTINLANLKVVDGLGTQQEMIQILGANGVMTGVNYYWLTEAATYMPDGWYDDNWNLVENVTLKNGEGIIFYSETANAKLQYSGQVVAGEQNIPLGAGFNVAGNSSNINVDLQTIKISGGLGTQQEMIQVLGANGVMTGANYYWLTEAATYMPDGWYDDSWNLIENITVNAGQAFVIYVEQDCTLVIPSQL